MPPKNALATCCQEMSFLKNPVEMCGKRVLVEMCCRTVGEVYAKHLRVKIVVKTCWGRVLDFKVLERSAVYNSISSRWNHVFM